MIGAFQTNTTPRSIIHLYDDVHCYSFSRQSWLNHPLRHDIKLDRHINLNKCSLQYSYILSIAIFIFIGIDLGTLRRKTCEITIFINDIPRSIPIKMKIPRLQYLVTRLRVIYIFSADLALLVYGQIPTTTAWIHGTWAADSSIEYQARYLDRHKILNKNFCSLIT